MLTRFATVTVATVFALAGGQTAHADIIAEWNFNSFAATSDSNGFGESISANVGSGTLFTQSATTTGTNLRRNTTGGTTLNATVSTPAGGSLDLRRGERWNNGYLDVRVSTTNLEDLIFSFAAGYTTSFPTVTTVSWSVNEGTSFTSIGSFSRPGTNAYTLYSYDLSAVEALNNQANVWFRLSFSSDGGAGSSGSGLTLDNVLVQATVIPEPASLALMGLGGLLMLGRSRRV